MIEEAWEKMGFPGDENWPITEEERFYSGRFRALEDIINLMEELKI